MKEFLPVPARSSLVERAQKIRVRMLVEQLLGISAANKVLFLSLCQTYEGGPVASRFPSKNATWERNNNDERDWNNWEDWQDWLKLGMV